MTSEENAALDAVFTNYYKEMRPLAVAYTLEAYRREVERLFGVGGLRRPYGVQNGILSSREG